MKKAFLLGLLVLFFCSSVFASETISQLTTNSPVPLDQTLTITGKYVRTDINMIIYCKFLTIDKNSGLVVDRLTDEQIFTDGTFYAETKITEPPYYRTSEYIVRVYCGGINEDVEFVVGQREGLENFFFGELFFWKEHGGFYVIILVALLILVGVLAIFGEPFFKLLRGR